MNDLAIVKVLTTEKIFKRGDVNGKKRYRNGKKGKKKH